MNRWNPLIFIAWAFYVISYFLPTADYGMMYGYQVFYFAAETGIEDGNWFYLMSVLSNLLILMTFFIYSIKNKLLTKAITILLFPATVLNAFWYFEEDSNVTIGYYLWFSSFMIMAIGMLLLWHNKKKNKLSSEIF